MEGVIKEIKIVLEQQYQFSERINEIKTSI